MSRVAVLKGGASLERDVSLRSGANAEHALLRLGHQVEGIDVGADLVDRLRAFAPDVCFVALHGRDGEDGTVQEVLELLGLPYTGSRPAGCARCMDKALAKHLLADAGVPTPAFVALTETAVKELGAARALDALPHFPVVVKPASQGSSLGIKHAATPGDVPGALVNAFSYDSRVVLERFVEGRDLAVSLLGRPDGPPQALPVVEAIPRHGGYDFQARYEIGATDFAVPADLPDAVAQRAQALAVQAWAVLGCEGFARADLLYEEATGELWVLEVNAIPGLTDTSLLPQAAEAAGIGFDDLIARVLALAT